MTYTEWRDELKNNLLSVSENERRRVLDYYAEAYADRREAGFSEREIIEEFGAPYDAAQRILCDRADYSDDLFDNDRRSRDEDDRRKREDEERRKREDEDRRRRKEKERSKDVDNYRYDSDDYFDDRDDRKSKFGDTTNNTWLFVILCIIFAVPIFGLLMGMVGITIGFCVAPFAVLISGIGGIIAGIAQMIAGELIVGLGTVGVGVIVLGVGIILIAVFTKLIKIIWNLWNAFFKWLKGLFGIKDKERA